MAPEPTSIPQPCRQLPDHDQPYTWGRPPGMYVSFHQVVRLTILRSRIGERASDLGRPASPHAELSPRVVCRAIGRLVHPPEAERAAPRLARQWAALPISVGPHVSRLIASRSRGGHSHDSIRGPD